MNVRDMLETEFGDHYRQYDGGHGIDHIREVNGLGLWINKVEKLGLNPDWITIISYYHDLYSSIDHDNHHALGCKRLLASNAVYMDGMSEADRHQLARAVFEHRASYKGAYTSIYSELLSTADRGRPKQTVTAMLERSAKYAQEVLGLCPDTAVIHAHHHVKEKYGRGGYARYPNLYRRVFANELNRLWDDIDALVIPA